MNEMDLNLLRAIADIEKVPQGAYNLRKNGELDEAYQRYVRGY